MFRPFLALSSTRDARRAVRWFAFTGLVLIAAACSSPPSFTNDSDDNGSGGNDSDGMSGSANTGGGTIDVDGDGGTSSGGTTGGGGDAVCGNGELEIGELCDDGGKEDDDGCSSDCLEADEDFLCLEEGEPCVRVVTCGNSVLEGAEGCDDGNEDDDDGCPSDCLEAEAGYSCSKPGAACVVDPVCGNGTRERGEGCDDGDEEDDDGCDSSCQLEDESEWFCPPSQECVPRDCGDGVRTPEEQCDDADLDSGDGCSDVCEVETGWLCSKSGCKAVCGDGLVQTSEECDDENTTSGDGCSAACKEEPFFDCDEEEPSVCQSIIVCGDGTLHPGEWCDPGITGQEACYPSGASACQGYDTGLVDPPECDNGTIEFGEECDGDPSGTFPGCDDCSLVAGYVCPAPDVCFLLPDCGDGILQAGETCDLDGFVSGPGCDDCQIEDDWFCSGEPSVCEQSICGDGFRAPDEQCDDGPGTVQSPGTPEDDDGCSASCTIETGYICPPGIDCLADCGDGFVRGTEECDSPNTAACANCRLRPGYQCGVADGTTATCTQSVCGNGTKEAGEGCDPAPGNTVAGDGCGATCQIEPAITPAPDSTSHPTVAVTCGDGIKTGSEGCDDGNQNNGDGCSSICSEENGWDCSGSVSYPAAINFKVTYRDFTYRTDSANGGHPHMNNAGDDGALPIATDLGIVGPACTTGNVATCGRLDNEGKPQFDSTVPNLTITGNGMDLPFHTAAFALWYRDSNTTNTKVWADRANQGTATGRNVQIRANPTPIPAGGDVLQLGRVGTTAAYQFSSNNNTFYPLGSTANPLSTTRGFGNYTNGGNTRNWNFTSELRYYFQYQGGETLTFFGDDDVFVFINGRLAVDIGGIHGTLYGRVLLGDSSSDCSVHAGGSLPALGTCYSTGEQGEATDARFNLTKGNVYEIVVFQAERRPTDSNYQLTLDGFLAPRSTCNTTCGDGIRAGSEVCDTGNGSANGGGMPSSGYGACLYVGANDPNNCTFQFCGDGVVGGSEACDNGVNADLYDDGTIVDACAPGCLTPPSCGDGQLQVAVGDFSEECDLGTAGNTGGYGGCTASCQLGPYCGDGDVDGSETCDTPGSFTTYASGPGACNYNCRQAPYCGDGTRNGTEICDGGANCNSSCETTPFCGDGIKTSSEACDYGQFGTPAASTPYGGCTNQCALGPHCGDETVQSPFGEECDEGEDNEDSTYDGCTLACLFGPHCGDGTAQTAAGEACDNGFNEDDYAYPGSSGACGADCSDVPYCGDGDVQSAFELCDRGVLNNDNDYDGCTTVCDWGPYCGDGTENGDEDCDDGPDNVAYSPDGEGCSYECETDVPYCGDGVRNGPEQCDLGTDANDGDYGGCKGDCTRAPFCGDKKVQGSDGEQCDHGPAGSLTCSTACRNRDTVK